VKDNIQQSELFSFKPNSLNSGSGGNSAHLTHIPKHEVVKKSRKKSSAKKNSSSTRIMKGERSLMSPGESAQHVKKDSDFLR